MNISRHSFCSFFHPHLTTVVVRIPGHINHCFQHQIALFQTDLIELGSTPHNGLLAIVSSYSYCNFVNNYTVTCVHCKVILFESFMLFSSD